MPTHRTRAAPRGLKTLFDAGSLVGVADGPLLERFALRDGEASEAAFAALVERHGAMVWRTCRAVLRDDHDAADAFQATFLVLVRKAGSLWVGDSIAPWLHRVALRAAVEARRASRRRLEAERRAAGQAAGWEQIRMPDDLVDVLHREIDRLPGRHRAVVVLCDLEGRPYEEAAAQLGCPVGTVKSRLARARERLRAALTRRGVAPSAAWAGLPTALDGPPRALAASTTRGCTALAAGPIEAAGAVSRPALLLGEGVLRMMIRSRIRRMGLAALAVAALLVPAWAALARQAAVDRPGAPSPPAGQVADRPSGVEGNWILRGYPSGQAFGLIRIEGTGREPRAALLSITMPDFYRFAESTVDRLRIDEETVRFRLHLHANRPVDHRTIEVVAYRHGDGSGPDALWGSIEFAGQGQYPAKLERTGQAELDRREGLAPEPGIDDLRRYNQAGGQAEKLEILHKMLATYDGTPLAQLASTCLVIERADAGAPEAEVRDLMDRAVRVAGRYGREMEIGATNWLVKALVGKPELEGVVLDHARKAAALLRPSDPIPLQQAALKSPASALRKSARGGEARALAEAQALDDRVAALARPGAVEPTRPGPARPDRIPRARTFAVAREQARAEGKLIMVDFFTESCGWCKRLDSDVFPDPAVAEAMRPFVPVRVNADDGEGHPVSERFKRHIRGYPAILFLDPTIEDPKDSRIVGKIPGYMPPSPFVEQLHTIARLPRDIGELERTARPEDGDTMRLLATAMAMRGRTSDAVALIGRARGPAADPDFDRWAAVYNTLGDEVMLHLKLAEAAGWYEKAARVARRPIDVYNAHLGAGFVATLRNQRETAARELEAAARVDGVSARDHDFAREWLGNLTKAPAQPPG